MHEGAKAICTRVIDGDTIEATLEFHVLGLNLTLEKIRFRMEHYNSPEMELETKVAGEQAKTFLESLILNKEIEIWSHKQDKYGRWLATVFVDGMNVNKKMVSEGYGVPYEK